MSTYIYTMYVYIYIHIYNDFSPVGIFRFECWLKRDWFPEGKRLINASLYRVKRQFGGRDIINFKYSVHFMHIRDRFTTNEVNSNIEDLRNIFFFASR